MTINNLLQVNKKDDSNTNITVRKTYLLCVDEFYIEPCYNVRDIAQTHVDEFRDAFSWCACPSIDRTGRSRMLKTPPHS